MTTAIQPISADYPCGVDLEYDPGFAELVSIGERRSLAENGLGVDWSRVLERARHLERRAIDLRLIAWRIRADLNLSGFDALASGVASIAHVLRTFPDVHPRDPDGDKAYTASLRVQALAPLIGDPPRTSVVPDLNNVWEDFRSIVAWTDHGTPWSLHDVRQALFPSGRAGEGRSPDVMRNAVAQAIAAQQLAVSFAATNAVREGLDAISAAFREAHGDPDADPVGARMRKLIESLCEMLRPAVGTADAIVAAASSAPQTGTTSKSEPMASGPPTARSEAVELLDRAARYFEIAEPSNPASLLIRRAQRVASMNFIDAINELIPNAVDEARLLAGRKAD